MIYSKYIHTVKQTNKGWIDNIDVHFLSIRTDCDIGKHHKLVLPMAMGRPRNGVHKDLPRVNPKRGVLIHRLRVRVQQDGCRTGSSDSATRRPGEVLCINSEFPAARHIIP